MKELLVQTFGFCAILGAIIALWAIAAIFWERLFMPFIAWANERRKARATR